MNDNEPVSLEIRFATLEAEYIFIQQHISLILTQLIANLEKSGALNEERINSMESNIRYHSARIQADVATAEDPDLFLKTGAFCLERFDVSFFGALDALRARYRR